MENVTNAFVKKLSKDLFWVGPGFIQSMRLLIQVDSDIASSRAKIFMLLGHGSLH